MDIVIRVVQLILCLSLLVFVHELGHFLFAKLFKTRVEKFYLFFNPWFSLFKFKIGETEYGIGWIPFGGYVKISGMIDESMDKEQMKQEPKPYEFRSKPAWQRLLIMVGGVFMNILTAFVIYVCLSYSYGESFISNKDVKDGYEFSEYARSMGFRNGDKIVSVRSDVFDNYQELRQAIIIGGEGVVVVDRDGQNVEIDIKQENIPNMLKGEFDFNLRIPFVVDSLLKDSVASVSGVLPGDSLVSINGMPCKYRDQVVAELKNSVGDTVSLGMMNNGSLREVLLVVPQSGKIGVYNKVAFPGLYNISVREFSLIEAIPQGFTRAKEQVSSYLKQLKLMVDPQTEAYKQIGSVVAMGKFFPPAFDSIVFWNITALFSIMLAVLNILPIPALDGGHVVFLLYEVITRRKPSDKFMEYAQMVGMFLLFALMIFAFGNDIIRLFR